MYDELKKAVARWEEKHREEFGKEKKPEEEFLSGVTTGLILPLYHRSEIPSL